jgi:hypothetical protein
MTDQRGKLEDMVRELGGEIAAALPEGFGFAFVLFDFGETGSMAYASNGSREDIIKMLAELRGELIEGRQ